MQLVARSGETATGRKGDSGGEPVALQPGSDELPGLGLRAVYPDDGRIGGQLQLLEPQPGNPMFEHPRQQVPVRRAAEVTGLVHNSGRMLPRINTLSAFPTLSDLGPNALDARKKLRFVVERGHHHMPPLPPRRVIAVVTDDEAPEVVVLRVNSGHRPKAKPRLPSRSRATRRSWTPPACWPADPIRAGGTGVRHRPAAAPLAVLGTASKSLGAQSRGYNSQSTIEPYSGLAALLDTYLDVAMAVGDCYLKSGDNEPIANPMPSSIGTDPEGSKGRSPTSRRVADAYGPAGVVIDAGHQP